MYSQNILVDTIITRKELSLMKSICIKVNNKSIIDYLLTEFSNLDFPNVYISQNQFRIYQNVILHYNGNDVEFFYNEIACILTNCIFFFYEKRIIQKLISLNYFYFNDFEKKTIVDETFSLFDEDNLSTFSRYELVLDVLKDYLKNNKCIILNGFVTFRIKDYINLLDETIDTAVNKFLIEKEYYEFITILKLYANSKESEIPLVHFIYKNKESILFDENKNKIPVSENLLNAKYLSDISFSSNDYALNTLLNLLPQKIIIHLIDGLEDEFINTLKLIFEDRICICEDCTICHFYQSSNIHIPSL